MPKRRAASRWLSPSTWQAWRTLAYSSTAFILTLPAVRTGRKIRRRLFTPPPRPDTPAASVRDFLSAAYKAPQRLQPPARPPHPVTQGGAIEPDPGPLDGPGHHEPTRGPLERAVLDGVGRELVERERQRLGGA